MIFDFCAVVGNFSIKVAHSLIIPFSGVSYCCVACVCNDCHQKNQRRRSKMDLTSHLSDTYDAFSSSCFSFSSLLSPMTMSPTNQMMKVLGPGSLPGLCIPSRFELSVDCVNWLLSS